jgi:hypothetical protein
MNPSVRSFHLTPMCFNRFHHQHALLMSTLSSTESNIIPMTRLRKQFKKFGVLRSSVRQALDPYLFWIHLIKMALSVQTA